MLGRGQMREIGQVQRRYGEAASSIQVGTETLQRLTVLARLGTEPDPAARRRLFEALAPVWRVVDGDGRASPYRRLLRSSAERWRIAGSPVDATVASVGLASEAFEPLLRGCVSMRFHPNSRASTDQRPGPKSASAPPMVPARSATSTRPAASMGPLLRRKNCRVR